MFASQEIYRDRKKFSKAVFEVASSDLVNMGITVVSYTLKDIRDEEGYLKALGSETPECSAFHLCEAGFAAAGLGPVGRSFAKVAR